MDLLTRKNGIWLCIVGIGIFLFNFITYSLWEIDVDILGAVIFILGLVMAISCGKSMKKSSKIFSRRSGVIICVAALTATILFAYSPIAALNGDITGMTGLAVFTLGIILIVARWRY